MPMSNSSSTVFEYSFAPPQVFVATTTDLTLTISNPIDGPTIQWQGGPNGDEIDVTFPAGSDISDLMNQLPVQTKVLQPQGFSCVRSGDYFAIKSAVGTTIEPGDKIVVVFENAVINGKTGSATTGIQEYVGPNNNRTSVAISKIAQELAVIAWLDPYVVGLYEQANLNWQSAAGIGVKIFGFSGGTGEKDFPVSGDPPYPGTTKVNVPSTTESQRTYTLQVYTGDNRHAQQNVTLTQHSPLITSFTGNKTSPLKVNSSVTLTWHSLFGAGTTLSSNSGLDRNNPQSPLEVNPGKELLKTFFNNYSNLPETVTYTLAVNGFQEPAYADVSFTLAPVGLVYFKYTTNNEGLLSGVKAALDPEQWTAQKIEFPSSDLAILTFYQPGGKAEKYYLGSGDKEHPQIQYFNAVSKGDNIFEFSWVTANLDASKGMVLLPGNIQITGDEVASGSKSLQVTSTAEYTLSGVGINGQSIVSKLVVQAGS